jgi:hypothetical protein
VLYRTNRVRLALFLIFEPTHVIQPAIHTAVKRFIGIYLDNARQILF